METPFGARLARHAATGGSPALMSPGFAIGYAELLSRVGSCARWLVREGGNGSEPVGITVAEEVPHLVTTLALLALGIPQVCLPARDPAEARERLARRLGVRRLVATDPKHALAGTSTFLLAPSRLAPVDGAPPAPIGADPHAPAIYYASSGTTGAPKIYALSQHALAWRAERHAESERIGSGYRSLTPVAVEDPMARHRLLFCAWLGHTSIVPPGRPWALAEIPGVCASLRASCLELTVSQASSLAADAGELPPLPADIAVYAAGIAVPAKLRRQFRSRFGVPLFVHYGAREFGRIATTFPGGRNEDTDTVGMPVPWIDLEIVDGEGRALPRGEIGEVRVRSECMTREYLGDPDATARHFRDGWFYPRDQGSLGADGALHLHGRTDEMMNLAGIKIFPAEIERVLEEHPAVRAAAAFAKPSVVHGEIPIAAVELSAPAAVATEELMAAARERLGVRAPRKIIVVDALPRNAAGKIVKRELANFLARSGPGSQ